MLAMNDTNRRKKIRSGLPQHDIAFGSGAAVLAAFADRPLLLQVQASCRVAANQRFGP
jgi:hypothetical protein